MSIKGILAVELTKDSVNKEKLSDFVRGSLIPEMLRFDGYNPKSTQVVHAAFSSITASTCNYWIIYCDY